MFWWMKQKRNPDQDLKALTDSLKAAIGAQLKSVIVFGSLARGEFDPQKSNVNVLIIAELPVDVLQRLDTALKPWLSKGHAAPVLAEPDELPALAKDFPIEFLDMREEHRTLFGEDPLSRLVIDRQHLLAQCTHDLALVRLRLRQAIGSLGNNSPKLGQLLAQSISSVVTLLRAASRIDGEGEKIDKMESIEKWSARVGIDISALKSLKDESIDNKGLAAPVLNLIDHVLNHLRK
jgi:predicted nucleotidyltransferase